jgi:hypothetical protein
MTFKFRLSLKCVSSLYELLNLKFHLLVWNQVQVVIKFYYFCCVSIAKYSQVTRGSLTRERQWSLENIWSRKGLVYTNIGIKGNHD